MAVAALVMETAEPGIQRLQPIEDGQRVRHAPPSAQVAGFPQQGVTVADVGDGVHRAALAARNGLQPVRVRLVGVVVFEDQMDAVGVAVVAHPMRAEVVDLHRLAGRK